MLAGLKCGADLFRIRPTFGSFEVVTGFIEAVQHDAEVAAGTRIVTVGSVEMLGRDGLMDLEHELGGTSLELLLWLRGPLLVSAHLQVGLEQFLGADAVRGHAGGLDVVGDEVADRVAL